MRESGSKVALGKKSRSELTDEGVRRRVVEVGADDDV